MRRDRRWPLNDELWKTASCGVSENSPLPRLILRNTKVGIIQDAAGAWPPNLDLEGFKYDRLGGFGGWGEADMRARKVEEWRDWLARDRTFSTQPYTQLAGVLQTAGNRVSAETILYYGRERERLNSTNWISWLWLTMLSYVVGYGIGIYTFRGLLWVLVLTILGTAVLSFSPNARSRGLMWRMGCEPAPSAAGRGTEQGVSGILR